MATTTGLVFLLVFLLAPRRGIIAGIRKRRRQRRDFAVAALVIHLMNHENTPEEEIESEFDHLQEHLRWDTATADRIVQLSIDRGLIEVDNFQLNLTPNGRELALTTLSNG